jgi:hypothetical protein
MSKKNKRKVSRQVNSASVAQPLRSSEFNPDYTHIKRELRRIAILAGTFLVILVVLAIFQEPLLALFIK